MAKASFSAKDYSLLAQLARVVINTSAMIVYSYMKWLQRKHYLKFVFLGVGVLVAMVGVSNGKVLGDTAADIGPAQVVSSDAQVLEPGVEVSWLEAAAGAHPIERYIIERSRGGEVFVEIAQAETNSRSYIDSDGHTGDLYRIEAEDDQTPPGRSLLGEPVTARAVTAGDIHVGPVQPSRPLTPAAPAHTAYSDIAADTAVDSLDGEASVPAATAANTQSLVFDSALKGKSGQHVMSAIRQLSSDNQELLKVFARLNRAQRNTANSSCIRQGRFMEADLHILPDVSEMDGLLAIAACHAIEDLSL